MGARTAARNTRPRAPRTLFQLLGIGAIVLGIGHGITPARAGEITATTGTLGLGTLVNEGVSCTSGACAVTGGTSAGSNLFHRFDVFDTRGGAITGVTFDPGSATSIIVGILAPAGSFINRPISITGGSADLFWLSPGGLSIGNGGQFSGFSNLTLSTATDMLIGGLASFNYQNTLASDILNSSAGFDGVPLNGLGSQGLTSTAANPGALSIDGALLTVDQSLLLDAENGSVSLTASSIEPFAKDSPPSITINADTITLAADANQNRTSINADNITLQGRVITANKSDLTASNGDLTLTAADSGQAQSALITASTLSSNDGSISIDAGSQSFGSFRIQISNSDLNATGGNITLRNGTNQTTSTSNTGVLISDNSSLTATVGAFEFPTGIIDITGSGAFRVCSTSCFSRGIEINGNSSLSADTINLSGSGGGGFSGGGGNDSIPNVPASDTAGISIDSSVLNANSLSLTGNAGSFNTNLARGIQISSSQLSGKQNLLLNGNGGTDANGDSSGIRITSSNLSSGDSGNPGSLTFNGRGGSTNTNGPSRGVLIDSQSALSTTGGSLTLTGTPGVNLNSGGVLPNDNLSAISIDASTLSGTSLDGSSPILQINSLGSDSPTGSDLQDGFTIQNSQIDGFSLIDINSAGRLNIFDSKLSTSADGGISLASSFVPSSFSSPETALNLKGASLTVPSTGTAIAISADSINSEASGSGGGNTTITGPTITIQGQKSAFSKTSIVATNGNINVNGTNNISRDDTLIGSIPSMEFADSSLAASNGSVVVSAYGPLSLTSTDLTALNGISLGTQTAASSLGTSFSDASLLASGVTSLSATTTLSVEGGPLSIFQSTLNTKAGALSIQSSPFYVGGTTLAADAASVRIGNSTLAAQGGSLSLQGSTNSLGSQAGAGIDISTSTLSADGGNISLINSVNNVPTSASSTGVLINGQSSLTASATQVEGSPIGGSITINGSGAFRNGTVSGFSRGIEVNGNSTLSADTITLTGSGGDDSRGGGLDSVLTSDTTGLAIDGSVLNANSLSLTGYAGNLNTTLAEGIRISSSQLSGRQTLLVNGTGGYDANGDSTGIRISASTLSSGDSGTPGSLAISGRAGDTNRSSLHRGILIDSQSTLATTGGNLTLTAAADVNSGAPLPDNNRSAILIDASTLSGTSFNGTSPTLQINSLGSDSPSGSDLQDGFAIQNSQIDGFALIDINSAGRLNITDSKLSTTADGSISLGSSFVPSPFASPQTVLNLKGASLSVPSTGTAIAINADSINSEASANDGSNTTITGPAITIQGQKSTFSKTSIVATSGDLTVNGTNNISRDDTLIGSIPSMEFADSSLAASNGSVVVSAYGPLSLTSTDLTALSEITLGTRTATNSLGTSFSDASLLASGLTSLSATTTLSVEGGPLSIFQSTLNTKAGALSIQSSPFYVGGTTLAADAASVRIGNSTLAAQGGSLSLQGSTDSLGSQEGAGVAISASNLSATGGNISITNTADPSIYASASSTGVLIDGNSSLTASAAQIGPSPVGGAITITGNGAFRDCTSSCFSHGIEINGNSSLSADTITLSGSGGDGFSGGAGNDSIPASDTSGVLIDGSILNANALTLTGNAGSFNTNLARGIQISSSQLSGKQSLLLIGNGGAAASGDSSGIRISASTLSSGDSGTPGSLTLNGRGGSTNTNGPSRGILIDNKSSLATTGGSLTLTGTPGLNLNSGGVLPNDNLSAISIDASTLSGTSLDGSSPILQINSLGSDSPTGSALQDGFAIQNSQIDGFSLIDINSAGRLNITDSKLSTTSGGDIRLSSSFVPLGSGAMNPSPGSEGSPPPPATINLSNSTLSTFPENALSGTDSGGTITIKADAIATYKTALRTSGTSTGGEITIGSDPAVGDNDLTDTVSIFNSTLFADPPTLGGIINIYGKNITILDSTLNLRGGSGGSLTAGGPSIQSSPSNTTYLLLNSNTVIYSSSTNAPLQFNSSDTLINDAQINPDRPSPNPDPPSPPPSPVTPTVKVILQQTLAQDPLTTDPQTSTQLAKTGGPLLSDTTPQTTPTGEIAVNLVPSGDIPITPETGGSLTEGAIPLDQRPTFSLSSSEAQQNFDSGNAEAQEDTANKLGLTEDEQLAPPSAADLQKAMQAATRWIRSGATGDAPIQNSCGGEGQVPCAR